jgi:hypothetical protein
MVFDGVLQVHVLKLKRLKMIINLQFIYYLAIYYLPFPVDEVFDGVL